MENISEIIEKAKTGDKQAKDSVIKLMQENKYMHVINRYLYTNRLLEPDDVRSEFWLGVVLSLPKVNIKIGDPLFYLAWQGANRVKRRLHKEIGKGVQFTCLDCGYVGRLFRKNKEYTCKKCGSTNYQTHQREINLTTISNTPGEDEPNNILEILVSTKPDQLSIDLKLDYEYASSKLAPREREVFKLIVEEGYEPHHMKEISEIMDISAQCVKQYLDRIKLKLSKIKEEMK